MRNYKRQSLLVHLHPELSRRALAVVNDPDSPYGSLSELVSVALENQLGLEEQASTPVAEEGDDAPKPTRVDGSRRRSLADPAARRRRQSASQRLANQSIETASTATSPSASPVEPMQWLRFPNSTEISTRECAVPGSLAISPFTNRLNPLVVGPRVLANMTAAAGAPPSADAFADQAARSARSMGLRLRTEDNAAARRGRYRRWTAWPVGDDEHKTLVRFRKSFMLWAEGDHAEGPLVDLGLVVADGGVVYPTADGLKFAMEAVPGLDGTGLELLSERQRELLTDRLVQLPGECSELETFLAAMEETDGLQDGVDKRIAQIHTDWSEAQVVSHRAAMIGRLRDLLIVDVVAEPDAETRIIAGPAHDNFKGLLANQQRSANSAQGG